MMLIKTVMGLVNSSLLEYRSSIEQTRIIQVDSNYSNRLEYTSLRIDLDRFLSQRTGSESIKKISDSTHL